MTPSARLWKLLLLAITISVCHAGLIKRHRHKNDDSDETLLAVGLIAKALADHDSPPKVTHCPAPIQVTKVIPYPVHKERIVFVKDKDCGSMKYHESRQVWSPHVETPDSMEVTSWRGSNEF